jgi:hypothetical protein
MISSESYNNFKYYSKVIIILLVVFLLLRFMLDLKPYEAILLSSIIAVSILIIENIIFINNNASDPLNCNQCKVSVVDDNTPSTENSPKKEQFIGNLGNHFNELYDNVMEKVMTYAKNNGNTSPNDNFEYKCIKVPKGGNQSTDNFATISQNQNEVDIYNNGAVTNNTKQPENKDAVEGFEQFMDYQIKQNTELKLMPIPLTTSSSSDNSNKSTENQNTKPSNVPETRPESRPESRPSTMPESRPSTMPESRPSTMPETRPETRPESRPSTMPESRPESRPETRPSTMPETRPETRPEIYNETHEETHQENESQNENTNSEDLTYSVNYVQYQKDGLQQEAAKQSAEINQFRRNIADQDAITPWSENGYKYYSDIFTRSVGAPNANEALTNELKYGDLNYIGPINKGMINKEYTFVSPSNWYPIPPHPPVCVTNKSCTTCPIQISNGKDYMNFAPWADFDQARRFTGDMGINIDYVKNVLNNPNGF